MALTRDFGETVRARLQRDRDFRESLLHEALERTLSGDIALGKASLHFCIDATESVGDSE
jgi:hypothetical protein